MRTRLFLFSTALAANIASAEDISGTLFNTNGAVITGARVLLMSEDYVKLAETKSGKRGEFTFIGLKPALYFVQAKKPMFQLAQHHVLLKAGQPERIYLVASVARGEDRFAATLEGLPDAPGMPETRPRVSGTPEPFKRLSGRPPVMPDSVRQRGIRGAVALYATIQTDGSLTDVVTLESPDAELERACRASFEQWRYAPMQLDGVPVRSNTVVVFEFNPALLKR